MKAERNSSGRAASPSIPTAQVLRLVPRTARQEVDDGLVEQLELLLSSAKEGRLTGLLFALKHGDHWGGIGLCGNANGDSRGALAIAGRVLHVVNVKIDNGEFCDQDGEDEEGQP